MPTREKAQLLNAAETGRTIERLAHEIVEKTGGQHGVALIGIRRRGVPLAQRLARTIRASTGAEVPIGMLDITLYRDDLSRLDYHPVVRRTEIPFSINDKKVVLVDDVLFTGRTVRSALDALMDLGRPQAVQLAVMVDRGHRELPIRADYVGKNVPTSRREIISVQLTEVDKADQVVIKEPSP